MHVLITRADYSYLSGEVFYGIASGFARVGAGPLCLIRTAHHDGSALDREVEPSTAKALSTAELPRPCGSQTVTPYCGPFFNIHALTKHLPLQYTLTG